MATSLASLLFGAYRRDALALLLLHPESSLHVREIARITRKAPGTLLRELNQLADAGLLVRRPVGNQVHFQANSQSPVYEDLRNVLKKTAGVADVLREALEPVKDRIDTAFVYGSVARGDEHAGSDIDVMIVGKLSFTAPYTPSRRRKRSCAGRSTRTSTRAMSCGRSSGPGTRFSSGSSRTGRSC